MQASNNDSAKISKNSIIDQSNEEQVELVKAFDTLRWVDIPIDDDDEEGNEANEEEPKEFNDRNAGKFIEDEANDEKDGGKDENDDEPNEYEEDEGIDDEKSKNIEINEHRELAKNFEKPLKELKIKKAKPGEEKLIDDEDYEEDSFVVKDDEKSNCKSVKGLKEEAAELEMPKEEPKLLKKKRRLIKKIIEDSSEEEEEINLNIKKSKSEEKPAIPNLESFIKKRSNIDENKMHYEDLPKEDRLIEKYYEIKKGQIIELDEEKEETKPIEEIKPKEVKPEEIKPKEEDNKPADDDPFKELDEEDNDKENQKENWFKIYKAIFFDEKMVDLKTFKEMYGEEGEAARDIIIEELEKLMQIRVDETGNEHAQKAIMKLYKVLLPEENEYGTKMEKMKIKICEYFNIDKNKIIETHDYKLVEHKLPDGSVEIITARNLELKQEKAKDEQDIQNIEEKEAYIQKENIEIKTLRDKIKLGSGKIEEMPSKKFKYNKGNEKFSSKSFGIVIMMTKDKYDNENLENNANIHIPHCKKILALGLLKALEAQIGPNRTITKLIMNHEHGDENNKCHMQCFIKFADKIYCRIIPKSFIIDEVEYLFITQKAEKEIALETYCKKKSKMTPEWEYYLNLDLGEKGRNIKEYLTTQQVIEEIEVHKNQGIENFKKITGQKSKLIEIFNLPQLDKEDLIQMAKDNDCPVQERIEIINNYDKILKFHKDLIEEKPEIKVEWKWPQHAEEFIQKMNNLTPEEVIERNKNLNYNPQYIMENDKLRILRVIKNWFFTYCMQPDPENPGKYKPNNPNDHSMGTRKKALLIHGPRGIGKTVFCKTFLIDKDEEPQESPLIVYCKGAINSEDFQRKEETAQLLMLDDVNWVANQKQMMKQLITGQSTTIRSLHSDKYFWPKNLPCIVLTNELTTFNYLISANEFKGQFYAISIDEYIDPEYTVYLGPDGTRPDRSDPPMFISAGSKARINKLNKDKEAKKEMKAMFKVYCN